MTATPHSAHVFIVVDPPVQDYEESLTILGVYGSLQAAQMAHRRLRARYEMDGWRELQIQEWIGEDLVEAWTHTRGCWFAQMCGCGHLREQHRASPRNLRCTDWRCECTDFTRAVTADA